MIGGGKWDSQRKILNGAYINFGSKSSKKRPSKDNGLNKSTLGKCIIGETILK